MNYYQNEGVPGNDNLDLGDDDPGEQAQNVWELLEPLPSGWERGEDFTYGLHPSTDVFDDLSHDDDNNADDALILAGSDDPELDEACEKGEPEEPDQPSSPDLDDGVEANIGVAPPEPSGPPPALTAPQRARLHALLQQRDPRGRAP